MQLDLKSQTDIAEGNYRWAATVLNHLVFAEPTNQKARDVLASVYTQMAYSAESGPWRNFYLTGAQELEEGITTKHLKGISTFDDVLLNLPLEKFYDYMAVRLDRSKSAGKTYTFNLVFPDIEETISLYLVNDVLHNRVGILADNPTATITMDKSTFNDILLKKATAKEKMMGGAITIDGDRAAYGDFQSMVAAPFTLLFNLIEP